MSAQDETPLTKSVMKTQYKKDMIWKHLYRKTLFIHILNDSN